MNNRVTIEDIAKKLNKSKGLVSLALSNKYGVSEETRSQIILEAIKMGYPLTKKKTNCSNKSNRKVNIMLVFCSGMLMDDFYWAKVVSGIEQTLRQHKAIVSFMEWNKVDSSEVVVSLYRSECDGIIIVGSPEMEFQYYPLPGTSNKIERKLLLDNQCPFEEAERLIFSRTWGNDGKVQEDDYGNEARPSQVETPRWSTCVARDEEGVYPEGFAFYLDGNEHTLTLQGLREPMLLEEIRLVPASSLPKYEQVASSYTNASELTV